MIVQPNQEAKKQENQERKNMRRGNPQKILFSLLSSSTPAYEATNRWRSKICRSFLTDFLRDFGAFLICQLRAHLIRDSSPARVRWAYHSKLFKKETVTFIIEG